MTNFIPIFPLAIVVYPGEQLNLHIFEPRYKQLINDCFEQKKPFGIPAVINNKVKEMGTLVEITAVIKTYEDGKMPARLSRSGGDITTKGLATFKILEIVNELPDKLYKGAIVTYPYNNMSGSASLMKKIISGIRDIHKRLSIKKDFVKPDDALVSYDVAHHAGMPIEDEYLLLELELELHRQEFLKRHIAKVLPVLKEMDLLKKKVKLNGHFNNLSGFKFS